jgi:predicted CoA-binding protein
MNRDCELPLTNAAPEEIRRLLKQARTIAVVGISDRPDRPSYGVAAYLQAHGFRIFPVNPNHQAVLGETCYPSLRDVPDPIDIVDIFRRPEAVPPIVAEAIGVKARAVWMQEGIVHNGAADQARAAGLIVVMNKCILKEHRRLS